MKREDLKKLLGDGATDEIVDGIMKLNGQDLESEKSKASKLQADHDALKAQLDGLNTQLAEAGKQIEAFKGMDIDGVKKAAADWQAKAEQAQKDAQAQLQALRFDHALDTALLGAKPRNGQTKLVKALLDQNGLKFNEADGSIVGLKEQLEKVKTENAFLFEGEVTDPKIVDHVQTNVNGVSAPIAAAYKAAGIPLKP